MSLLTNPFALGATISLAIQLVVLFLLIRSYMLKRQLKFREHGLTMAAAVFLHLAIIFSVMIPAFAVAVVPQYVIPHVSGIVSIISLIHVPAGIIAVALGLWLVVSWRFGNVKNCFKKKRLMLWTLTVWSISLAFGIALYFIFYWTVLTG
jgi:uncharacterized membrane protein YozB (DUF420 family)